LPRPLYIVRIFEKENPQSQSCFFSKTISGAKWCGQNE